MQELILFITHTVASLVLIRMIWAASKAYKIPVTIHNLPIIIMGGMWLAGGTYLAMTNFIVFMSLGLLVGGIMFVLNSVKMEGHTNYSLPHKLLVSLFGIFFWTEFVVFTAFYTTHSKTIDANEKPES